jgi:N-acetyl-gamma-glutamyl-phosphate reductase
MVNAAICGGSGYTGGELLRLLRQHPYVAVTCVTSKRFAGKPVSDVFPNLRGLPLWFERLNIKTIAPKADLFFICLPHKTSQDTVAKLMKAHKKVIDLSADYRLKDKGIYQKWYEVRHKFPQLMKKAVYGLPELHRSKIKKASLIANPGCYPVSALLALAPVIGKPFIDTDSIIIDAKSGLSGAGRNPALPFLFAEANESVKAYAVTSHRHTPEIEQELGLVAKKKINVIFTPHLIPMDRGILSTVYIKLKKKMKLTDIKGFYRDFYKNEPFVRILERGAYPSTKAVRGSNFCDISIFLDAHRPKAQTLIVVSAIDNLMKGASGLAVQNMNILYGFEETAGLLTIASCP